MANRCEDVNNLTFFVSSMIGRADREEKIKTSLELSENVKKPYCRAY
jgi:predicted transcriptional regulator